MTFSPSWCDTFQLLFSQTANNRQRLVLATIPIQDSSGIVCGRSSSTVQQSRGALASLGEQAPRPQAIASARAALRGRRVGAVLGPTTDRRPVLDVRPRWLVAQRQCTSTLAARQVNDVRVVVLQVR